ncbi:MAG: phosphonate ABC transporter ATP-binding protein [Burkholderiales bacterium]|nr:phosphonate ABC transporter ATP-binding protein [Burkholderiales bacterium]
MLAIDGLVKVYPGGQRALDAVDLVVSQPQVVAVIGSSGAGKSTLIRCINRLVEPSAGAVRLNGVDIVALGRRDLRRMRRRIGMIFQEFNLVERLTVMENVLSGRLGSIGFVAALMRRYPPRDVASAFELLDRVGLAGYQDTRADALSGGQRQRVGIARALMQQPELLLIDEPTASLDPKTARQIMRLIRSLAQEQRCPALVNIHDVTLAQDYADRVVGLKAGRVVFDAPAQALTPQALTAIYGEEDWNRTIRPVEDEALEAS